MGNVSGCHSLMTPPLLPAKDTVTGLGAKCPVGRQAEARGWPGVSWRGLAGICSLHSGEVLGVSGRHRQRFRLPRTPEPSLCLSEKGEGEPAIPNAFPQPARPALRRESRSNNGSIRGSGSCRRPTSSRPHSPSPRRTARWFSEATEIRLLQFQPLNPFLLLLLGAI